MGLPEGKKCRQKKCRLKLITANLAITPTPSSPPATRPLPSPPHFTNPSRHRRNTNVVARRRGASSPASCVVVD